jgi:putative transposase
MNIFLLENLEIFRQSDKGKTIVKKDSLNSLKSVHEIVSHQFKKFFQSYSMAYNKQQQRVGTLFQTPFKRVKVDNDQYFTKVVYYIHSNPQKHGLIPDFRNYEWSSYQRILIEKPTKLRKREVLDWFGGREAYTQFHDNYKGNLPEDLNLEE